MGVGSGADPIFNGMIYDAPTARFSFTAFDTSRSTIYVHVELLLTLSENNGRRRRMRLLLQQVVGEQNQIRHSIGSVSTAGSAASESSSEPIESSNRLLSGPQIEMEDCTT